MNTECIYVLKDGSLENAKEFCDYIDKLAEERCLELYPTYVSIAKKDFKVTFDYDGWHTPFKIKKGEYLVWVYGKDYDMNRVRPKGARRGFPYAINDRNDFPNMFEDIYKHEESFASYYE